MSIEREIETQRERKRDNEARVVGRDWIDLVRFTLANFSVISILI